MSAALLLACSIIRHGEVTARFDDDIPPAVPTRTVTNRYGEQVTVVQASINGEVPGWFVLVSGSFFCILDADYAADVDGLSIRAKSAIPYPCKLPVGIYWSRTFSVGRLTINNLDVAVFDLSQWTEGFEDEIVGIVGFPLFEHASVEIRYGSDGGHDTVSVFEPGAAGVRDERWQPLQVYQFQPVLTGRVNRQHEARCVIDTGSPGTLSFYSAYAARHDLLEGREVTTRPVSSICGETTEVVSRIRAFEIAGTAARDFPVSIMTPGSINDVGPGRTAGIVGRAFLRDYKVVFDVPNDRVAFTSR